MTLADNINRAIADFDSIKNAIENKGVDVGTAPTSEYADKISQIETGDDYYDIFWDAYQNNGERTDYLSGFAGYGWSDITFRPKYDIKPRGKNGSSIFSRSLITDLSKILNECGVILDTSECTTFVQMFAGLPNITRIPTISLINATATAVTSTMFYDVPSLTTIEKIISSKETVFYPNMFSCKILQNITFEGEIGTSISLKTCPLTAESAKSVITHLVNYAGTEKEFTCTVSLSDNVWGLLAEETDAPNGKTWVEYVDSLGWNT